MTAYGFPDDAERSDRAGLTFTCDKADGHRQLLGAIRSVMTGGKEMKGTRQTGA